ncbi:hypothetical protein LX32DRAFT_656479 [Colletotrichum zoysiae]|uniref:Carbohydrate-binding module family 18 protein n=1 Tax=Colletotrichum zoysiae TaxID=1216348 RepID=A0AAD9LZL2_9PEZI|nr:hypothetical protein LX32DRAFT_656479 [Colletotrichum zoysiae]
MGRSRTLVSLTTFLLTFTLTVAANECQPATWSKPGLSPTPSPEMMVEKVKRIVVGTAEPGEVNCRYTSYTGSDVNYYTCTKLALYYEIPIQEFFLVNPDLKPDCSNIQPNTEYCVDGFIEPVRAWDGVCGPASNNATCIGTDNQCCNAETWTCGNTEADCAPGTCWEGACEGDSIYSTDGTCGYDHGFRRCAGKWGDCCNFDGVCGTGEGFCGIKNCQSGNCTRPVSTPAPVPWLNGNTPDGTCGGASGYTCNVVFGYCCNKDGICASGPSDCGDGCQPEFGKCGYVPYPVPISGKPQPTAGRYS